MKQNSLTYSTRLSWEPAAFEASGYVPILRAFMLLWENVKEILAQPKGGHTDSTFV